MQSEPHAEWAGQFATTHWSVVMAAGDSESPEAASALKQLCETYWPPIYSYVRRKGFQPEESEDLTQEFFLQLLQKRFLKTVRRERGRFRAYLLVSLNHFLANEWKKKRRQKRGGDRAVISIEQASAEKLHLQELDNSQTPERIFERRWAEATLETVLAALEDEYANSGRAQQFDCLRAYLSVPEEAPPQTEIALELGMTEGAVKQAVFRLRERYRSLLRRQIAQTVAALEDVEEELRYLIAVLRG